jgi:hypothetical protein
MFHVQKARLMTAPSDTSVASILMTLAGSSSNTSDESSSVGADQDLRFDESINSVKDYLSEIYSNSMNFSIDDFSEDIDDSDRALLSKDRSSCTTQDLEMIRRERNRIHAKKTRLRKKRVLQQMEGTILNLEEEVQRLKRDNLFADSSSNDASFGNDLSAPLLLSLANKIIPTSTSPPPIKSEPQRLVHVIPNNFNVFATGVFSHDM